MRTKITACVMALVIGALTVGATSADAQRWRGRHHGHHGGWGWGAGAGFAAGALLGGALASRPYYGPGHYDDGYAAVPGPGPDAVSYCSQRFKSYDPASGTYLGYDGLRHSCP